MGRGRASDNGVTPVDTSVSGRGPFPFGNKNTPVRGVFMLADANECPAAARLAEAKTLLAVAHGERAAAVFAAPYAQATVYKVVGGAVPLHAFGVGLHSPIKPKGSNGDWTVNNGTFIHSILSYG